MTAIAARGSTQRRALVTLATTSLLIATAISTAPPSAAVACDELFTDPKGDAGNEAPGGDGENVENLDIVSGGIAHETETHFTTQIKVKNLTMDHPPNANASINWYFHWTYDGVNYFSRARVDTVPGNTAVYSFGTYEPPRYVTLDATTGSFNPGENGTVQVDVPLAAVGAPPSGEAVLTDTFAVSSIGQGVPGASQVVSQVDRAPDEGFGVGYPLGKCQSGSGGGRSSPRPRLRVSDDTPKREKTIRAVAALGECPGHAGTSIHLQRRNNGEYRTVKIDVLNERCLASFAIKADFKWGVFRVKWPRQDADHSAGLSKRVVIKTHR